MYRWCIVTKKEREIIVEDEKILDAEEQESDSFEANIRPQTLKEYEVN